MGYFNDLDYCNKSAHPADRVYDGTENEAWGGGDWTFAKPTPPVVSCPSCGAPMDVIEQPALMKGREATQLVTCWQAGCAAWGVTADTRDTDTRRDLSGEEA